MDQSSTGSSLNTSVLIAFRFERSCLLGLFDEQMPMLYGEGAEKAFLRLQEEIMASSDDQSLFT